jgi:hypothetical protein
LFREKLSAPLVDLAHRLDDDRADLVGVSIGSDSSVFEASLPAVLDCTDRNPDRSTSVCYPIAKLVDVLCFMLTGQSELVVSAIDGDMFVMILAKCLTDLCHVVFTSLLSHLAVGEVTVHPGTVSVS